MDFRCGMNNLFVHSCKIKHIWNEFCLLFGFKPLNHASNSTSAEAILKRGIVISESIGWGFLLDKEIMSQHPCTFPKLPRLATLV